ncbi:MAG: GNAT family N-acetyltransferase [Lachnospiraceae bacterium]|nr:GNAT family N-acetyltransferase [Lachnospiraceae bacterium]
MVRFAEEEDVARVNELREQVNSLHVQGRPDVFKGGFCQQLQDYAKVLISGENSDIVVVERDGVICGMACVDYVRRPETLYSQARNYYHVQEIAVDEAYRRQGVATEMLGFMNEDAKKRGLNKIELDVWAFNESAIEFYEAMGFRVTRRWMEYEVK